MNVTFMRNGGRARATRFGMNVTFMRLERVNVTFTRNECGQVVTPGD